MIDQATINLHYVQAQARRLRRLEDEIKELKEQLQALTKEQMSAILSIEANKSEMAKEKI